MIKQRGFCNSWLAGADQSGRSGSQSLDRFWGGLRLGAARGYLPRSRAIAFVSSISKFGSILPFVARR
jgi:hypothetical protein